MLPETLAGLSPELIGLIGTIVGVFGTKVLDGLVALFKSTVTTPMRLKTLEDEHATLKREMKTNWDRYEELKKELTYVRDRDKVA